MAEQGGGAAPASGGGLQDNIAGLLVYLIGILAIVFLLIEPYNKNKFIRFHCFQCIFFWVAVIAINIVLFFLSMMLGIMHLGIISMLLGFVGLALYLVYFVVWVLLMIKAYQGQKFKLPFIGDLAEKQAG